MTREEFIKNEIEKQKVKEKSKVFKKFRVVVYEQKKSGGYPFADFETDNFYEAVSFAKKMIQEQKNYRKDSEYLWVEINEFQPIHKRNNVIYPYKSIVHFGENDIQTSKYEFGGDFQSGVYENGGYFDGAIPKTSTYMTNFAMGGSLQAHGIKEGDTFMKTISGTIQKVKDKNGKIVYINLSNGERGSQPPLPFNNGGMVSEDLFENYNKQPKKLAEIVDFYMAKYDEGEMDYQDTKNFLKEVEAIGYTFDYGLDNEPYGLRPIGTKLKEYDEGGEVTYFLNKDGIKVRSKVEPKRKLSEAEWMAKHNESKEARTYGFGGLFSKSGMMSIPKAIDLNQEQVRLKSGEYVQVLSQQGDSLMVMELSKLGSGASPKYVRLSDVDMTSLAKGGGVGLIGNQKRIDMNKNGKIDAEDFKLLRSSMNGAYRNERKHVNHNEDYEIRYARKKPARTGYKGKRKFATGGGISNLNFRNFTLNELIQNLPADVSFMYISKKNSTDKIRISDKEFKNFKFKHWTITDYGNMELSRGSENLYLDIMVYEASKETPEVEYTISIYTKDNHKGLKQFANNLVEKFATGGGVDISKRQTVIAYKDGLRASYFVDKTNDGYKIIRHTGSVVMPFGSNKEKDFKDWFKKNTDSFKIIYATGGGISNFERLSRVVAKNYEGKRVKPQYQKEYGKVYSKAEAKEVGNKVAGKMKMMKKAESGAEVKKTNRGGVMVLAKKIRKEGESWKDALKRAGQQLK
jgi:hypothetical protein